MKNLFKGKSGKITIFVVIVSVIVTGCCAFVTYKYLENKRIEKMNIELAEKADAERKAKKVEEEKKLKELRDSNGIEGIASFYSDKYSAVITNDEKSLLLNYEEYMMTAHSVDDFDKFKAELDDLVAQLDTRFAEWEAEQQRIKEEDESRAAEAAAEAKKTHESQSAPQYPSGGGVLTPSGGVNWFNGIKETYYNLDMSQVVANAHAMGIQGDYWVRGDGVKMLGNYIMVASSDFSKGTIIQTSLGTGIVVDAGCASGVLDIAVTW